MSVLEVPDCSRLVEEAGINTLVGILNNYGLPTIAQRTFFRQLKDWHLVTSCLWVSPYFLRCSSNVLPRETLVGMVVLQEGPGITPYSPEIYNAYLMVWRQKKRLASKHALRCLKVVLAELPENERSTLCHYHPSPCLFPLLTAIFYFTMHHFLQQLHLLKCKHIFRSHCPRYRILGELEHYSPLPMDWE